VTIGGRASEVVWVVGGGFSEVTELKAYYYVEMVPAQIGDQVGDIASPFLKDLKAAEVILV